MNRIAADILADMISLQRKALRQLAAAREENGYSGGTIQKLNARPALPLRCAATIETTNPRPRHSADIGPA
jgi:hypothetical protein